MSTKIHAGKQDIEALVYAQHNFIKSHNVEHSSIKTFYDTDGRFNRAIALGWVGHIMGTVNRYAITEAGLVAIKERMIGIQWFDLMRAISEQVRKTVHTQKADDIKVMLAKMGIENVGVRVYDWLPWYENINVDFDSFCFVSHHAAIDAYAVTINRMNAEPINVTALKAELDKAQMTADFLNDVKLANAMAAAVEGDDYCYHLIAEVTE